MPSVFGDSPRPPVSRAPVLGWLVTGLLVAYVGLIHHGLGGTEMGAITRPWQPTGFLRELDWVDALLEHWALGILVFSLPPALGLILIAATTRSSVARTLGACSLTCVALMAFYGLSPALRVWEFFHWRASVVIGVTGIALGCTLAAPVLAERALAMKPRIWALIYLPAFFAVASIIRNATGSDADLFLNFSPWPAIPVLGLEIGVYGLCGLFFGLGLGLAGLGLMKKWRGLRLLSFALGALFPLAWLHARFPLPSPEIDLAIVSIGAGCMILVSRTRQSPPGPEYLRRAVLLLLGTCLVAAPLFVGRALADGDYAITRHIRAQEIIDALAAYQAQNQAYPEQLSELVDDRYLESLPRPRIGFGIYHELGLLPRPEFEYRNLGPSYVLEFSSTAWVMCAYNPPWILDEGEEPEDFEDLTGAWSCPDDRPDLW